MCYSVTVPTSQMCDQTLCLHRNHLGYCMETGCVNHSKFMYAVTTNRSSISPIKPKTIVCPCCGHEFEVE